MIKALMKLGIERMFLNMIKVRLGHAYNQHHAKWGKTENISSKVRNKRRVSTFSTRNST
jgi:hypothetical protein